MPVKYNFDARTRTLNIMGTGRVPDRFSSNFDPDGIKRIVVGEGITTLGIMSLASDSEYQHWTVSLPRSLKKIEEGTFYGQNIDKVALPPGITRIPPEAFEQSAVKAIKIPSTVTDIGARAFYSCYDLRAVNIPPHLVRIGELQFAGCAKLRVTDAKGGFVAPRHLLSIGRGAFGSDGFGPGPVMKYAAVPKNTRVSATAFPKSVKIVRY